MTENTKSLDKLGAGQRGLVSALIANSAFGALDSLVTLRLKELGFLPGTILEVIGHGFFGADPIAVRIGNTKFALRGHEARKVLVQLQTAT
jgi:ferrous iron transport protein A